MFVRPDSNEDESTVNIDGGWQFHPQHVGLLILVIVMFYWLYNYSILAPWLWVNDARTIFRTHYDEYVIEGGPIIVHGWIFQ